jgi:alkaline phosphatase
MPRQTISPRAVLAICCFLLFWFLTGDPAGAASKNASKKQRQQNVIVLLADGTGATHTTIARWFKGGPLALDRMFLSGMRTYGTDSLVTDSAPAATAFATGFKSNDKFVGIAPAEATIPGAPAAVEEKQYKPLATVLEAAKVSGKSVGLVATSNIQHASPAGYSAHVRDRSDYNEIAEQQVYLNVDVVFGGGKQYLLPAAQGGKRQDGEDLIRVLRDRGTVFIETRDELLKLPSRTKKVWGLFAADAMAYEFDRPRQFPGQPSLAEMTRKAIEILSRNPKGFFLFVEGSKVDWASHANDPIGVISDVLAFDQAVGVALDFAQKNRRTLVLSFSDHGNGGLSLGNKKTDQTYSKMPLKWLVDPLKKATLTGEGLEAELGDDLSEARIKSVMAEFYGLEDLTSEEVAAIQKKKKGLLNYVVGPMISSRSVIGWTTNGHTGEDLFFYYYGLYRPMALIENTAVAKLCADHLRLNLQRTDRELFQGADLAFAALGASVAIDAGDPANKVLLVTKGSRTARLPFSKDIIQIDGREHRLNGLTVYADRANNGQGRVYVPRQAVELFLGRSR